MSIAASGDLSTRIGANLPFLRRYARALTGQQSTGDAYAAATLEAILTDPSQFNAGLPPKVALFKVFHAIWSTSGSPIDTSGETGLAAKAQKHLSNLTQNTREALLLHTIEELSIEEVGQVMNVDTREAQDYIDLAAREMAEEATGRVMIIEDEPIIAMDLEAIVAEMGHRVTGIARTEAEAIELAGKERPDLILSDIQLADDSSGIDAVRNIMGTGLDCPVIFITAFPERLLTGEGQEPAFLISKPYRDDQVRSAVSQAMFFSSTETLTSQV
ncbi:MAG: response regulator [Shimia sp.]